MKKRETDNLFSNLPCCARDFIELVIKKMRYRKKVRADVMAELAAHFEDELRDCKTDEEKQQRAEQLIEEFGDAKLLGVLLRRAKKRCRPLWRTIVAKTFQTIGVLILCFIFYLGWFLSGKPAVTTDYVAELNRMVCPVADDSQNAMPFFEQAIAVHPNLPKLKAAFWRNSYFDANDAEKKIIADMVEECSPSLELVIEGVQKPYCWRQYKSTEEGAMLKVLIPNLTDFRRLVYAFRNRAYMQADRGEYKLAFEGLINCYKFGLLVGQGEKALIEQLIGIGTQALVFKSIREILSRYSISEEQLVVLQADIEQVQTGQEFRMRLLNEKLMIYDEIQRCFTEDRFGGGHLYPKRIFGLGQVCGNDVEMWQLVVGAFLVPKHWDETIKFLFFNPNKAETKQQADDFYDFIEECSKKNPAELKRESIDLNEQAQLMTEKGNVLLRILTPSLGKMHQLHYRCKADCESLPVIIAALCFKADRGKYPDDLAELQKSGYIKNIPIDPWSDEPLIYKKTKDDFMLYSVGLNFIDDGGVPGRNKKGQIKEWTDNGDAVFWPVEK